VIFGCVGFDDKAKVGVILLEMPIINSLPLRVDDDALEE